MKYVIESSGIKKLKEVIETFKEEYPKELDTTRKQHIASSLEFAEKLANNQGITVDELVAFNKNAEAILKLNKRSPAQAGPDMDQRALLSLIDILRKSTLENIENEYPIEYTNTESKNNKYTVTVQEPKPASLKTEFFDVEVLPASENAATQETHLESKKPTTSSATKAAASVTTESIVESEKIEVSSLQTLFESGNTNSEVERQKIEIEKIDQHELNQEKFFPLSQKNYVTHNHYINKNYFFSKRLEHVNTHTFIQNSEIMIVEVEFHFLLSIALYIHNSVQAALNPIGLHIPEAYQIAFINCATGKELNPEKPLEFGFLLSVALFLHERLQATLKPVENIIGRIIPEAYHVALIKHGASLPSLELEENHIPLIKA